MIEVPVPVLTDGVVTLRAHTDADLPAMVEMARDPAMLRWTGIPDPYDLDHARYFAREVAGAGWASREHQVFAIEVADGEGDGARYAGNLDVRGHPVAEVGYALHPAARGRGVMARALRLACAWALEDRGGAAVHWRAHRGNTASLRTAWAAGFRLTGTTPAALHERGRVIDAWTGVLLPGDPLRPRTTWWSPPDLHGDRAVLRAARPEDVPRVVEGAADPLIQRRLPHLPEAPDEDWAKGWLHDRTLAAAVGRTCGWTLTAPGDDRFLGTVAVLRMEEGDSTTGEVGYWTHPDGRGRGLVGEAVGLVVAHAFRPVADGGLGRTRLELVTAAGNDASNAVAESAGFVRVGRQTGAETWRDGTHDDLLMWELVAR